MAEVRDAVALLQERFRKAVAENCLSIEDVARQAEVDPLEVIDFRLAEGEHTTIPTLLKIESWVDWANAPTAPASV